MVDDLHATPVDPPQWVGMRFFPNHIISQLSRQIGQVAAGEGRVERVDAYLKRIGWFVIRNLGGPCIHTVIFTLSERYVIREKPEVTAESPSPGAGLFREITEWPVFKIR